jgi:DedD protein
MDRRVKERLIGASILAVLVVLIVPELLTGPAPGPVTPQSPVSTPQPTRSVTVDLATSKAPEPAEVAPTASSPEVRSAEAASAVSPPAAAQPAAAQSGGGPPATAQPGAVSPVAAQPAAAPSAPLETAAQPPKSAASKPASAGRAWAVQLGSFASRANADKLVRQLKAQGFSVYVLSGGSGSSLRYRVRVGPMAERGAAVQAASKLKALGHTASLVPPG